MCAWLCVCVCVCVCPPVQFLRQSQTLQAAMGRNGPLWAARRSCWPPWTALDRSGPLWAALGSFRPLWSAGAIAARWEALGFLGLLWPLQGGGFGESGVRFRARSTYTNTSTTEFHELPSNGLWPQLCYIYRRLLLVFFHFSSSQYSTCYLLTLPI